MGRLFDIYTLIASIGVIFATTSFVSGLQVVKRDKEMGEMMAKMHRFNGYISVLIYVVIATLSLGDQSRPIRLWPVIGWVVGFGIIALKIIAVRNEKFYKYASRLGLLLFIVWLVVIYKYVI